MSCGFSLSLTSMIVSGAFILLSHNRVNAMQHET